MNVGASADPANDLACRIAYRDRPAQRPAILAAMVPKAILDLVGVARRQTLPPSRPCPFLIVGMKHPVPPLPVGRTIRHTGELIPSRVVIIVEPVGQSRPDHVRQCISKAPERQFSLPKRIARRHEITVTGHDGVD